MNKSLHCGGNCELTVRAVLNVLLASLGCRTIGGLLGSTEVHAAIGTTGNTSILSLLLGGDGPGSGGQEKVSEDSSGVDHFRCRVDVKRTW